MFSMNLDCRLSSTLKYFFYIDVCCKTYLFGCLYAVYIVILGDANVVTSQNQNSTNSCLVVYSTLLLVLPLHIVLVYHVTQLLQNYNSTPHLVLDCPHNDDLLFKSCFANVWRSFKICAYFARDLFQLKLIIC